MAKATDMLTREEKSGASKTIMGGLGGTISNADVQRARIAYGKFIDNHDASGAPGDRLSFEEYVERVWKPSHKR